MRYAKLYGAQNCNQNQPEQSFQEGVTIATRTNWIHYQRRYQCSQNYNQNKVERDNCNQNTVQEGRTKWKKARTSYKQAVRYAKVCLLARSPQLQPEQIATRTKWLLEGRTK